MEDVQASVAVRLRGLGKTARGVHHGLFVARLKVGKVLAVLIQRLAESGDIAMAKNAEDAGNQAPLPPITLAELHGEKLHHSLGSRERNRRCRFRACHFFAPPSLFAYPIPWKTTVLSSVISSMA